MALDCGYYLLSSTAIEFWSDNNQAGLDQMLICLSKTHKDEFLKRLIYQQDQVSVVVQQALAETAFYTTWATFVEDGKNGKIHLGQPEYVGYFFSMLKTQYLRSLANEIRESQGEREYIRRQDHVFDLFKSLDKQEEIRQQINEALDQLGERCKQLLTWRHMEGLSHDEISKRLNVSRDSTIKMVSRCGKKFIDVWEKNRAGHGENR